MQNLGAILYRAGRFEEALARQMDLMTYWQRRSEAAADRTSPAYTYFFLAMAHHRLAHAADAQDCFQKGTEVAREELAGTPQWNREITLRLLQSEAEAVLGLATPAPLTPEEVTSK